MPAPTPAPGLSCPRFQGIRAVLFDLDGTLLDSAPDLAAAADRLRTARGLPALPLADYRPHASAGARGLLHAAFGISPEHPDFAVLREEFFSHYERSLADRTRAFDGVPELIDRLLQRGLRWGVVTNKPQRFTEPLTRQMPLFASASVIISGDTTAHAKPHPAPLHAALAALELPASQCLYVGDDERDIIAGRAAAIPTVAATYGYLAESTDVRRWQADAVIDAPLDLLPLL